MSFSATITLRTGVEAKHWRCGVRSFYDTQKVCVVTMNGYISKAAFLAGFEPVHTLSFGTDATNTVPLIYDTVRGMNDTQMAEHIRTTQPAFAGAVTE